MMELFKVFSHYGSWYKDPSGMCHRPTLNRDADVAPDRTIQAFANVILADHVITKKSGRREGANESRELRCCCSQVPTNGDKSTFALSADECACSHDPTPCQWIGFGTRYACLTTAPLCRSEYTHTHVAQRRLKSALLGDGPRVSRTSQPLLTLNPHGERRANSRCGRAEARPSAHLSASGHVRVQCRRWRLVKTHSSSFTLSSNIGKGTSSFARERRT